MRSNEKGSLICAPEVQAIVPLVAILENLKFRLTKEDGEMVLRRGEQRVKLQRDNGVLEVEWAVGEELTKELDSLTDPTPGHDELVAAWKTLREAKEKMVSRMKGLREFLGEREEQGEDPEKEKEE